jgi:hypothetical protein
MSEITEETYQTVRHAAYLPLSQTEVERLCGLEWGQLSRDNRLYDAYLTGQLEARTDIYKALMDDIKKNANVQAAKEMAKQFEQLQKEKDGSTFDGLT